MVALNGLSHIPITVDYSQVSNGKDSSRESGPTAYYIELQNGQANEFIMEPKMASGSDVRDITMYTGMEWCDIFVAAFLTLDTSIVVQVIAMSKDFSSCLSMDTSESQPSGHIDGAFSQTRVVIGMDDVSESSLKEAMRDLPNVGTLNVTPTNEGHLLLPTSL